MSQKTDQPWRIRQYIIAGILLVVETWLMVKLIEMWDRNPDVMILGIVMLAAIIIGTLFYINYVYHLL